MDTCKSDLINHLEFQENLSLYIINKLHHGKWFCTIFTHSFVFTRLTCSQSLARSFCENKLVRKYRTLALSMKNSIFRTTFTRTIVLNLLIHKIIRQGDHYSLANYSATHVKKKLKQKYN